MSKKLLRSVLAVLVLITTAIVFVWYFKTHPEVIRALGDTHPQTLALLFLLYGVFMATLIWIQRATLELCDLTLGRKESSLLVMYSSIINFFGPLQSGPAFRAAYLKARHDVSLKKYTVATLMYYGFYALFSGLLLLSFFIGWWVAVFSAAVFAGAPLLLLLKRFKGMDIAKTRNLALATLSQVAILSVIFFVQIHSLMPTATYLQSLAYTGAANFALFVSLTPGAIGFREAFLVFSQSLHHISTSVIAAASVMDRGVYICMLLILAALIFGLHANTYLQIKKDDKKGK